MQAIYFIFIFIRRMLKFHKLLKTLQLNNALKNCNTQLIISNLLTPFQIALTIIQNHSPSSLIF